MGTLVRMRRHDTGTPWGFRMNGGSEFSQPLYIQKVTLQSISYRCGLRPGDAILKIGKTPTTNMSHDQAKMTIIREGNELNFVVDKGAVDVGDMEAACEVVEDELPRAVVTCPTLTPWRGAQVQAAPTGHDPNLQSRSFKVIQRQTQGLSSLR